jgi:Xaa-Pro dipeptidase
MRNGLFLDFPRSEYARRLSRIREIMEREEVEGLILTMRENIEYVSGFQSMLYYFPFKQFCLIVNMTDEPCLVVDQLHVVTAVNTSWVKNLKVWGKDNLGHVEAITQAVNEAGLADKRVGMELGPNTRLSMTQFDYALLRSSLPEMNVVDGGSMMRSQDGEVRGGDIARA